MRFCRWLLFLALFSGCTTTSRINRCPGSDGSYCEALVSSPNELSTVDTDEKPLKSTAGFEFEGVVPRSMEFSDIAEMIKVFLMNQYPEDSFKIEMEKGHWRRENTYHVIHVRDGLEYRYTVKPDTKLVSDSRREPEIKTIEITSPIMRKRSDASIFFQTLNYLRSIGLKSRSDIAGNHIHRGLHKDITYEELERIYSAVDKILDVIMQRFAFNKKRGEPWINVLQFKEIVQRLKAHARENPHQKVFENLLPDLKKRTVLRVDENYHTLELRIFNSNINPNVNNFAFDFTLTLFDEAISANSPLNRYLQSGSDIEWNQILDILSLDRKAADIAFEWSRQRRDSLEEAIEDRALNRSQSHYVFPSEAESAVDLFWSEDLNKLSFLKRLEMTIEKVSERDKNIALFDLINTRDFERLPDNQQLELLNSIESSYSLQPFLQKEIWAIRVVQHEFFPESIKKFIQEMKTKDETFLHPLIRRMVLRYEKSPEDIAKAFYVLSAEPMEFGKFVTSFDKYLQQYQPNFNIGVVGLLVEILRVSPTSKMALRVLKIINELKFEVRDNWQQAQQLFDTLLPIARKYSLVADELFKTLQSITRQNTPLKPHNFFSNVEPALTVGNHRVRNSRTPKFLSIWVEFLALSKEILTEDQINESLKAIEKPFDKNFKILSGIEKYNVTSSLKSLVQDQTSDVARKLKSQLSTKD